MDLKIIEVEEIKIAQLAAKDAVISTVQDAIDLLGNADYLGARRVNLEQQNLDPKFFDLKTGIAGEILQKYANYQMKLAIIGEFEKFQSNALSAFIVECNRGSHIFFVPDHDSALKALLK